MILIGYQGIGKSSTAKSEDGFIDLESGNFFVDGERAEDWHKAYCNIAEHLSKQGYKVFVSSHKVVREILRDSDECVVAVYPILKLKGKWIERLRIRYENSGLEKDRKAYLNALDCYDINIKEIMKDTILHIEITDIEYNLKSKVDAFVRSSDFFNWMRERANV